MSWRSNNFIFGGNSAADPITIYHNARLVGSDGLHDLMEFRGETGSLVIECVDPNKDYSQLKARAADTHRRRARARGSYKLDNTSRMTSEAQMLREAKALKIWRMPE